MKQISQTIIIFFLTLLLASVAPAGQLPGSNCQSSVEAANSMPACCQAVAAKIQASGCPDSKVADHNCPQGDWCQVDVTPETYWRASGGLHLVDYAVQNLATIVQSVNTLPAETVVPGPSPPVNGSTPRYILICAFLI